MGFSVTKTGKEATGYSALHRARVKTPSDFDVLCDRMEKAGYAEDNGFGDVFLDDMVEVFKPWLATSKPVGPQRRNKNGA